MMFGLKKKLENFNKTPPKKITLPKLYWDITDDDKCYISYEPNKKDYITGEWGLVTIEVGDSEQS